jgi:hypothetical protein
MPTISRTSRKKLLTYAAILILMELLNLVPEDIAEIVHPTAVLACAILVAWALSIRSRILRRSVRIRLISVAGALILLFMLALSRWLFFSWSPAANRILWYAYYIPFTFVPLQSLAAALRVGEPENERPHAVMYLLWPLWALLCALFLTNGLHGWLFVHKGEGDNVSYGWLYTATVVWSIVLVLGFFFVLIRKSRLVRVRRLWFVPTAAFLVSAALLVWYFIEGGAPTIGGVKLFNLQESIAFMVVLIWESVIQIGLVPSNTDYEALFRSSHLNAVISGEDGEPVFVSEADGSPRTDCVTKESPIPGGTVAWTEDRSAVHRLSDALLEATETLEGENDLIREENRISAEKAHYEAANRLYDRIIEAVRPELERVDLSLENEERFEADLKKDLVLGAYIKRRANMELLAYEYEKLPSDEIWLAIRESDEYIALSGAAADVRKNGEAELPAAALLLAYDFFEKVAENALDKASAISALIEADGGAESFALTVETDTPSAVSFDGWRVRELAAAGMSISVRMRDETCFHTISCGKEARA